MINLKSVACVTMAMFTFFLSSPAKVESAIEKHTFSLSNTNSNPIWVALFENDKLLLPVTKVDSHGKQAINSTPDIRKSVLFAVWFMDPGNVDPMREGKKVTPEPDQLYMFAPGKTLYLSWRKLGILAPQAGMLWGLMPESREGFDLDLNVMPSDIIRIEED